MKSKRFANKQNIPSQHLGALSVRLLAQREGDVLVLEHVPDTCPGGSNSPAKAAMHFNGCMICSRNFAPGDLSLSAPQAR